MTDFVQVENKGNIIKMQADQPIAITPVAKEMSREKQNPMSHVSPTKATLTKVFESKSLTSPLYGDAFLSTSISSVAKGFIKDHIHSTNKNHSIDSKNNEHSSDKGNVKRFLDSKTRIKLQTQSLQKQNEPGRDSLTSAKDNPAQLSSKQNSGSL